MAKVGIVKIRQTTRPSFVSQNYSAKVNISDLGGVNLANVKDNDILVYSSNTGLWEVETSDFSIFLSSADKTNAAYDQANAATILAETPSHVANSASAYANGAFLAANSLVSFSQAAFTYANGTAAHSNSVNDTQNTNIQFAWNHSNSSFVHTNASFNHANSSFAVANSSSIYANGAFAVANSASVYANGSFEVANSASIYANGAFAVANSASIYANGAFAKANNEAGVNATQNTNITLVQNTAQASFEVANSASIYANGAFAVANSASIYANGSFEVSNSSSIYANGAFAVANSASIYANGAFAAANSVGAYSNGVNATQNTNITTAQNAADAAFIHANASFEAANNVFPQIQPSYNTANAAFIRANNSLDANNGGTITGDLSISGNLSVLGNTFTVSATTIVANDTVILLGAGNYTSDLLDIGISAHYNDGVNAHTGLIRDHGTKEWQLFDSYTGEIGANNDININDPSFKKATLNANLKSQSITLNNQNLQTLIDNAYTRANNSLNANTGGLVGGNVIPTTDNTYYLGSETNRWHSLYVGPGSIDLGGLIVRNEDNVLTVSVGTGLPTPIAGSDEYARNHVNAAFNFANTSYIETTYAENHANAAFLYANGTFAFANNVNTTQNNRITYTENHANAAFLYANGTFTFANNVNISQNNRITYAENHANAAFSVANNGDTFARTTANAAYRNSYDAHGRFKISADAFGRYIMPSSHPNQTNPGIYVEAGKTYAFELNIPFAGNGLTLRYFSRFGGTVANVTHISTSGVITTNSTSDLLTGTLYWTVPSDIIGTTIVYCNSTINTLSGRIEIINPALYQNTSDLANSTTLRTNSSFDHANAAFSWANAAYTAANNAGGADTYARNHANAAFIAANSAGNYANAAFLVANSAAAYSNTVNATQNTNITFAWNHANASFNVANNAANVNTTQNTSISFAWNHANAAFNSANSGSADSVARQKANASTSLIYGVPFTAQELWGMGYNNQGLLGVPDSNSRSSPIQLFSTSSSTWKKLQENDENFSWGVGIKTDGSLWVWGFTFYVYPPAGFSTSTPVIVGTDYKWKTVAAAENSMYLIDNNNVLWGVGRNGRGQLGDNTIVNKTSPITIGSNTFTWSSIAPVVTGTGTDNGGCLAIRRNGTLWAWGEDVTGVLGLGDFGSGAGPYRSSPTQVGANNNWSFISAGFNSSQPEAFSAAITRDGYLYTWGKNLYGQLGNGNTTDTSSPAVVGTNTNWRHVSCAYRTTLAIKTDGTLWAWGDSTTSLVNASGIHRSSPTQIGTSTDWKTVKITRYSAFGLKTNGTLWGWGTSQDGMLGQNLINGGSITSPSLLSFTSEYNTEIIDISPGQRTTYFIKGIT